MKSTRSWREVFATLSVALILVSVFSLNLTAECPQTAEHLEWCDTIMTLCATKPIAACAAQPGAALYQGYFGCFYHGEANTQCVGGDGPENIELCARQGICKKILTTCVFNEDAGSTPFHKPGKETINCP